MAVGAAVYLYFKSAYCGIAAFLAGVFLDIDHLFDCCINYGPHFRLEELYTYCDEVRFNTLSLIFHSYELLAAFWVLIFVFNLQDVWKALAIGATQHIFLDQLSITAQKKLDNRAYFLAFRLKKGFRKDGIIKRR